MRLLKKIGPALVPRLGPPLVRLLGFTWRIRHVGVPPTELVGTRLLCCFWHGDLLVPMYAFRGAGIVVLVSGHRDGQIAKGVLDRFGFSSVTGSITRGGAAALRRMLSKAAEGQSICIPPDGPKGPARKAKSGVAYLASRTGLPIVVVGVASSSSWRLHSWDRMAIPKPFARVAICFGKPWPVPAGLERHELERWAEDLGRAIEAARETAERSIAADLQPHPRGGAAAPDRVAGNPSPPARP
jgi:lysophospholipid acyltransferase (LPLAT)-like uncharacterized protein